MFICHSVDPAIDASTSEAGDELKDQSAESDKIEEEMSLDAVSSEGEKAGGSDKVRVSFFCFCFVQLFVKLFVWFSFFLFVSLVNVDCCVFNF